MAPPSVWIVASTELLADPADYVNNLRCAMQRLRAIPSRTPNQQRPVAHPSRFDNFHSTFFCHRGKPLRPPYDGPCTVISRTDKYYMIDVKGRQEVVSLDRLKPLHSFLCNTCFSLVYKPYVCL